ncbi:MAG: dethiobiotin synthase [Chitinophagaceae bacterium]|nr:dethiobiotin synthase [Chitinophagaceae bacterium]
MLPIFISGIGTGVGKTLVSAILTEALQADYWKPIQAGYRDGTDSSEVTDLISNPSTIIHSEVYKLKLPASPHFAARKENVDIDLKKIITTFENLQVSNDFLIIEGAGGLMVPLNAKEFIVDLITSLQTPVILVSRNYLGSINHSLMSAAICKQRTIPVTGWIFNDQSNGYEEEIANWSGYPVLASIPKFTTINKQVIKEYAHKLRPGLLNNIGH